jgi:hypothetical protein
MNVVRILPLLKSREVALTVHVHGIFEAGKLVVLRVNTAVDAVANDHVPEAVLPPVSVKVLSVLSVRITPFKLSGIGDPYGMLVVASMKSMPAIFHGALTNNWAAVFGTVGVGVGAGVLPDLLQPEMHSAAMARRNTIVLF